MTQLQAMLLSIALEVPVSLLVARRAGARSFASPWLPRVMLAGVVGTCLTHPVLWHLNTFWTQLPPWPRLLLLEAGAFAVEAGIYFSIARMRPAHAATASLLANAFSFGTGLVIYALWP